VAVILRPGRVERVNGPLVDIVDLGDEVAIFDVVEVGPDRLPGEVVAISAGRVTAQLYEYTGGLAPGAPVVASGAPLSAALGPGLLGGVFDGILRPLQGAPAWLRPGERVAGSRQEFSFTPTARVGEQVLPGEAVGTACGPGGVDEAVVVPVGARGAITWLAHEGSLVPGDVVARLADGVVRLTSAWPVRHARPFARRLDATAPLVTGQRVLDVLFPVAKGSTAAVVGGFGTGKTVLLQQIAKWCDADVIVYVACGERGNELADTIDELGSLEDPRTGRRLMERSVIIANTSNMPVMAREASVYTGMTVAEYFRDQGRDAVLIADSTSRWAEALREFSSRTGELPAEEGFPAGLASALAAFYERSGRTETLAGGEGSVTVLAAVSPPGGDVTEPVTAHTQRFVRGLWTLDRDLAYARHYPAVSWRASFSRDTPGVAAWHARHGDVGWAARRARLQGLLAEADRLESVAELVGAGALPGRERIVLLAARLTREALLQQNALSPNDATCALAKQATLGDAVLAVHDRAQELVAEGRPATLVESTDFAPLLRAPAEVGPDDDGAVTARLAITLTRLERSSAAGTDEERTS
jgi:V/A-type H+-transporting ATPase subunit A